MKTITLADHSDFAVELIDLGARISSIRLSGKELALRYATNDEFKHDEFYLGASIGPVANRVSQGKFTVSDHHHHLPRNEGLHSCHSGRQGFDKRIWGLAEQSHAHAVFTLTYPLNDIGVDGTVHLRARYQVEGKCLSVEYTAESDVDTYVNTTNHVYLNLSGNSLAHQNADIGDHQFELHGTHFLDVDSANIPVGTHSNIGSPLRYSMSDPVGHPDLQDGVDHHFNIADNDQLKLLMTAKSLSSEINLAIHSNSPGYQFYTGRFLRTPFTESGGFCVEPQYAPNAINQGGCYAPILTAGVARTQRILYTFSC